MMTCSSSSGVWSTSLLGECSLAWGSLAIIFFLILIARRQAEDGILAGTGFNTIGAFILGLGFNIIITIFTGAARWSLLGGIGGIIIGGFVIGMFTGSSESGGDYE